MSFAFTFHNELYGVSLFGSRAKMEMNLTSSMLRKSPTTRSRPCATKWEAEVLEARGESCICVRCDDDKIVVAKKTYKAAAAVRERSVAERVDVGCDAGRAGIGAGVLLALVADVATPFAWCGWGFGECGAVMPSRA